MKKVPVLLTLIFISAILVQSVNAQAKFQADIQKSKLEWKGKKVGGEHYGNLLLKEGWFEFSKGFITGGNFEIDMNSMTCTDLTDAGYNAKLIGHLKSDDFFSVKDFPTATFKVKSSKLAANNDIEVTGDLTIKGITNPISFLVKVTKEGKIMLLEGTALVDRAKYSIKYGSRSFFDNLGDKFIYDEFELKFSVVATE